MFRTTSFLFIGSLALVPFSALAAPPTPEIFSTTFPEENGWYRLPEMANFSYVLPEDVVRIGFDVSTATPVTPARRLNDLYETVPLDGTEFQNGVNYVNVQFFSDEAETDGSAVGSYKVQIDNEAPTKITAEFRDKAIFVKADDALSGVIMYEVLVDGVSLARIDGGSEGVTVVWQEQQEGKQVEVRAFDNAGNTGFQTFTSETPHAAAPSERTPAAPLELLVAILTLIAVSALLYAIGVRRSSRRREDELTAEVEDTKQHVAKIFTALKGEVKDQLSSLSVRKRLTKREEEVLTNMTSALELSEQLIQEEIDDLDEE